MPSRFFILALALILPRCGAGTMPPSPSASPSGPGDTWTPLTPLNEARQEVGVAALEGRIYVAGGFRSDGSTANTVEAYDVAAGAWSFAAPMPLALNHCAAVAFSGRIFVAGGSLPSGAVSAALLEYDPRRNDWQMRSPMPTARTAMVADVLGGRIYVAGGVPGGTAFEVYDPARDRWQALPEMPTARNHVAGGTVGTRFFAAGGRPPNTLSVLEAFDTAASSWARLAPLPTGRSGHAAAVVRGCLYFFGGEGNAAVPTGVFPQNEVYDPRTNTWESRAAMRTPRHGIGAAVVNGRIFIPGGAILQGLGATTAFDVYDPPAGKTCE
jgi:N-acetylneuraminic acid mutarotase